MSPDPEASMEFGRTRAQSTRAAVILTALGCGAVVGVVRLLSREHTPPAELLRSSGVAPSHLLVVGCAIVVVFAGYGWWRSVRTAPRFTITAGGLRVRGSLGEFTLTWGNIRSLGVTSTGAMGLAVADRGAVLETHRGTEQQREWLRTTRPYGDWDFLFQPSELGYPGATVIAWLEPWVSSEQSPG